MRWLTQRFGPLASDVQARVEAASSEERLLWTDRVLTAASLAEVFDDTRR